MKKPKLIAIAAMGRSRQIGLKGKLPWSIPEEYKHYQETVRGHYLIVGRKNYEVNASDIEIGVPLVLTRDKTYRPDGVQVFHSFQKVLDFLSEKSVDKAFVIGGAEIYSLSFSYLDELLLSVVDYDGKADTYFPDFEESFFDVSEYKREDYCLLHYIKC